MDPLKVIEQEWPVIQGAPALSFVLLLLGFLGGRLHGWHVTRDTISGLRERIKAKDDHVAAADAQVALARSEAIYRTRWLMANKQLHAIHDGNDPQVAFAGYLRELEGAELVASRPA